MKRVLVISHLPLSSTTNVGKTLLNLFDGYDSNDVSNLFFKIDGYQQNSFNSYLITDKEVFNATFHMNKNVGTVNPVVADEMTKDDNGTHLNKRSPLSLLIRDFIWGMGKWKNNKLIEWLEDAKPEVVFLAPGYSMFAYRVALYI